jgi:hypothetical protein
MLDFGRQSKKKKKKKKKLELKGFINMPHLKKKTMNYKLVVLGT